MGLGQRLKAGPQLCAVSRASHLGAEQIPPRRLGCGEASIYPQSLFLEVINLRMYEPLCGGKCALTLPCKHPA